MSNHDRSSFARWCLAVATLLTAIRGTAHAAQQTQATATQPGTTTQTSATQSAAESVSAQSSSAAPVSQQATPVVERPATPMFLGPPGQINSWLSVRGEFRGRLEGFANGAFRPNSGDGYMLDRFRINATVVASPVVKFVAQVQDARAFDKTTGGTGHPFRDTLDLRMAYGDFGGARNMVRVGRQELVFGEQRLIGALNWANNARSFDGVHATIARAPFKLDIFAASVVTITPDGFDKSGYGNRLYGLYGSTTRAIPKATVEPYFFWRQSEGLRLETGGVGDIHQATIGTRVAGKLPHDFDYGIEMAGQTGTVATDDVRAWAGHWVLGKTFTKASAMPRPFIEVNYASGDKNSKDGSRETFDQLYPTFHDKIGLADQAAWKNIDHLRGGMELKPKPKWQLSGSYHFFWLASPTDALYAANGTVLARSVEGTAGRFVGQEVDAQAVYTYSTQLQVAGGYARLLPGEFVTNTTPGESYSSAYLMVTYVFLGDRPAAPRGGQ